MKRLTVFLLFVAAVAHGEIYTWKDSKGTTHYVNSEYDIPERYRSRAKVLDLGIEQKEDTPPGQQGAHAQSGEGIPPVIRSLPPEEEESATNRRRLRERKALRREIRGKE